MATQPKPSFDDIIQEGRKKKKNEKLAEKIFRRGSTPQATARARNQSPATSLASRVGVQKRPQNARQSSSQASLRAVQNVRKPQVTTQQRPVKASTAVSDDHGFSIKGMGSGSCLVVAQNFAPGTTAGDIEAVMAPLGGDQSITSCRLISSNPTVIAELVFASRDAAQKIVDRFNNKMADGHRLHVYIQAGGVVNQTVAVPDPVEQQQPIVEVAAVAVPSTRQTQARPPPPPQQQQQQQQTYEDTSMEVDETQQEDTTYQDQGYQQAPPTQPRRAAPSYEDGRYGFGDDGNHNSNNANSNNNGAQQREVRRDNGNYRAPDRRYDDRRYDDRGYPSRGQGYHGQQRGYRQDYGGPRGQGRMASDGMMGRR